MRCPCCFWAAFSEAFQTTELSFDGQSSVTVTYHSCGECGYTCKSPIPEGVEDYYAKSWQSSSRNQSDSLHWLRETLRGNLIEPESALDVGARGTSFVDGLGCADTAITDPSVDGGFVGSEGFRAKRRYDLVCASHVMEHVLDIHDFLGDLRDLSSRVIFVEVPSPELETRNAENDDICRTHLHHFTLDSLNRLFRNNGIRVLRADMCSGDGSLSNRILASVEPAKGLDIIRAVQKRRIEAYEEALWKIRACWPSSKYALYGKSDAYHKLCAADIHEGLADYKVYDKFRGTLEGIREHEAVIITPRQPEVRNDIKKDLDSQGIKWIDPWA